MSRFIFMFSIIVGTSYSNAQELKNLKADIEISCKDDLQERKMTQVKPIVVNSQKKEYKWIVQKSDTKSCLGKYITKGDELISINDRDINTLRKKVKARLSNPFQADDVLYYRLTKSGKILRAKMILPKKN